MVTVQLAPPKAERLASLDALRGFDLFMLVFFQPVFVGLAAHWSTNPVVSFLLHQFEHEAWAGFRAWDLVMPLFLFMVGAAMPFSFEKFRQDKSKKKVYLRVLRRVLILFVLGMVVQGNLLSWDSLQIRLYTNTLQAIAVGYLIAAVVQLHFSNRIQLLITVILLVIYWAMLTFMGDFTPDGNFAEKVDRLVLGRFRDGVTYLADGSWQFSPFYRYTWISSGLVFGVTVMLGVFAGKIMKNGKDKKQNSLYLLVWAVVLLLAGWLLNFQTPIIKKIWSASMTLYSGGLCFLLMAIFYYIIDYKQKGKAFNWLKIYGMNSIVAYTLGMVVDFRSVAHSVLWGLEQYTAHYYPALLTFANYLILFFILRWMYKSSVFLKI